MTILWGILIALGALAVLGIAVFIWQVRPVRLRALDPADDIEPAEPSTFALRGPEPMRGNRSWYWCGMCQGEPCWRCVRARMGRR